MLMPINTNMPCFVLIYPGCHNLVHWQGDSTLADVPNKYTWGGMCDNAHILRTPLNPELRKTRSTQARNTKFNKQPIILISGGESQDSPADIRRRANLFFTKWVPKKDWGTKICASGSKLGPAFFFEKWVLKIKKWTLGRGFKMALLSQNLVQNRRIYNFRLNELFLKGFRAGNRRKRCAIVLSSLCDLREARKRPPKINKSR